MECILKGLYTSDHSLGRYSAGINNKQLSNVKTLEIPVVCLWKDILLLSSDDMLSLFIQCLIGAGNHTNIKDRCSSAL